MKDCRDDRMIELKISAAFNSMRERLESEFEKMVSNYGVCGADIVGRAFEYAARYLVREGKDFTSLDLEQLICRKARLLVRDIYRSRQCERGRRSVKAIACLDEDEAAKSGVLDAYSFANYRDGRSSYDQNLMYRAAEMVVDEAMEESRLIARNREVVRKVVFGGVRPQFVADEYGMTRNNVDQIVDRVRRRVVGNGARPLWKCYLRLEEELEKAA